MKVSVSSVVVYVYYLILLLATCTHADITVHIDEDSWEEVDPEDDYLVAGDGGGERGEEGVELSWMESVVKSHNYVNHAAIFHMYQYIDFFSPAYFDRFNDIAEAIPITMSIRCHVDSQHKYVIGEETDAFFKYLHIARICDDVSTLTTWHHYHPSTRIGSDFHSILLHEVSSADVKYRVGDWIASLDNEEYALKLLQTRYMDISDDSFIRHPQDSEIRITMKKKCVTTHQAIVEYLLAMITYVKTHIQRYGTLICIEQKESHASKAVLIDDIAMHIKQNLTSYGDSIHNGMYKVVIDHYIEKFFFPFLDHHFCEEYLSAHHHQVTDKQHETHNQRFMGFSHTSYSTDPTVEKTSLLFVGEKVVDFDEDWQKCVEFVAQIVHVDMKKIEEHIDHCEISHRYMYSKSNITQDEAIANTSLNDGGGSFSHRKMACLYWKHLPHELGTCIPLNDDISNYNALNLFSSLFTASDVLIASKELPITEKDALSETPLLAGKALILGLGGGELFTVLAKSFPFLSIDNVDISEEVLTNAWQFFGLKHLLCNVSRYNISTHNFEDMTSFMHAKHPVPEFESEIFSSYHKLQVLQHKYPKFDSFYTNPSNYTFTAENSSVLTHGLYQEDFTCRANMIVSDAWQFIRWKYEQIVNEEAQIRQRYVDNNLTFTHDMYQSIDYYDYLFIDVYGDFSSVWSGQIYEGESVSSVEEAITHLAMLRNVVRPYTGVVVFHVHKDKNFKRYYQHVVDEFGESQVTFFEICMNDAIFTATRDRLFREEDLQREEQECQTKRTIQGNEEVQCHPSWTSEKEHFDPLKDVISPFAPQFRVHIHPCDLPDKSILAKEIVTLGERLGLNPRFYYSFLTSLICNPFAFDDSIAEIYAQEDEIVPDNEL